MTVKSWIVIAAVCLLANGCNKETASNKVSFADAGQTIKNSLHSQDILEVVSFKPGEPAVLALGEKLHIEVFYELHSIEQAAIWARPYANGGKAAGYKAHHLVPVVRKDENSGIADCWFYFDTPAKIDEIRVFMKDIRTGEIVRTISYKISAEWTE